MNTCKSCGEPACVCDANEHTMPRELARLRAENERLTKRLDLFYEQNDVIEQQLGIEADSVTKTIGGEIERLQSELAALRRPAVDDSEVEKVRQCYYDFTNGEHQNRPNWMQVATLINYIDGLRQPVRQSAEVEAIRKKWAACRTPGEWVECGILLDAIDAAQPEILRLEAAGVAERGKSLDLESELARLSSPPQERREIQERQHGMRNVLADWSTKAAGPLIKQAVADIDTLLQDLRRYENSHAILMAERDEARAKCERLEHAAEYAVQRMESVAKSEAEKISLIERLRDEFKAAKLQHDSQERAAALALHDERIERLESERDEARSRVAQLTGELDLYASSLQGANASVSAYQRRVEELQKDLDHKAKWGQQFFDLWTAGEKRIEHIACNKSGIARRIASNARVFAPSSPECDFPMFTPDLRDPCIQKLRGALAAADGQQREIVAVDHEGKAVYSLSDEEFRRMNPEASATGDGVTRDPSVELSRQAMRGERAIMTEGGPINVGTGDGVAGE